MQRKHFFGISVLLISLFLLCSSFAVAKTDDFLQKSDEVLVFEAEEITDDTKLYERAVNRITDEAIKTKPIATLTKDGKDVSNGKIKTYTTVQKLKVKKDLKTGKGL